MNPAIQIAKHFREVYFGGNWTASNLKDQLSGVSWQEAIMQVYSGNTIATLVYHMNYYVDAAIRVLEGQPLDASDKFSFTHPPIQSREDWDQFLDRYWKGAEKFASLIEQMPEHRLWEDFQGDKYGNFYRNLHGIIEHCHYHLGQIALLKKIIRQSPGE